MIDPKIVEEMKRCAERATPGPWEWYEDALHPTSVIDEKVRARAAEDYDVPALWVDPIIETDCGNYGPTENDRQHIVASNPRNVLDLIADYESLLDRYNYPGR